MDGRPEPPRDPAGRLPEEHEEYHVRSHCRPAYNDYVSFAGKYLGRPMSKKRAECIAATLMTEVSTAYAYRAGRDGVKADCALYESNPTHPYCVDAKKADEEYDKLKKAADTALNRCPLDQ